MTAPVAEGVRCSAWARAEGVDPVGSAGSYEGFLLVDLPLPWPRDIAEVPEVAGLRPLLEGRGFRVQAMVAGSGPRRVVLYDRRDAPSGPFVPFSRREAQVGRDLAEAVTAVLSSGAPATVGGGHLLVCTHGRRDVCCGSRGTALAARLMEVGVAEGVALRRTSHTGGHRFAPTFIVLPEATAWAFADVDLVERVIGRVGDAADVADRYRGCAALGGPEVQALEREVLRRVGWDLLDRPRLGRVSALGDGAAIARLEVGGDEAGSEVWEGVVRPGRNMIVPDCMRPLADAKKSEHEWVISDVRVV